MADLDTKLTVEKTVESTPKNGVAYQLGEEIEYKIVVKNEGNVPYTNVHVVDEIVGLDETIDTLGVDTEKTFNVTYTVTQKDIDNRSVTNIATAAADPIDDPKHPEEPKEPAGEDKIETPVYGVYTLTIYYRYTDGTRAAESYVAELAYNTWFRVQSPAIAGYTPSRAFVQDDMPAHDLTYVVFYTRNDMIIEDYDTPLGLGNVSINVGECFE